MKPVNVTADLLVAGGGMAGICAAIAAARRGLKVVLVQDRSVLGGNASSEVRMHIVGADMHGGRKGWRESGIIEELRLEDAVRNPERAFPLWDVILYEKVIAEPNITLLLDTHVTSVEMEPNANAAPPPKPARTERMYEYVGIAGRIRSVRAVRPLSEDEFAIQAALYADCTGDGRLGFEAGADFRIGRESKAHHGESLATETDDIHTLGSSILITSRDLGRPSPFTPPPWARKYDASKLTLGRVVNHWEYGFWWVEWGGMIDTIKDNHTKIRHELYAIALGIWDYVKNSGKCQAENWALDWIGAIPGKRESRRFLGDHVLTQQDILNGGEFADAVAYGGWHIDLHPPGGVDALDEPPFYPHPTPRTYGIPLRSYFSRNIENLFFAGRDISATHVGFASTRVMATCAVGGEAVGAAAAMCVRDRVTPRQIVADPERIGRLRQDLLAGDATLPGVKASAGLAERAAITAGSSCPKAPAALVIDGFTRDELDPKTGDVLVNHGWRSGPISEGNAWIELAWGVPVEVSQIRLVLDTGFARELTLSPSDWVTSHLVRGPQPETLCDYDLLLDGAAAIEIRGNYQRHRTHKLDAPQRLRTLRLVARKAWGVNEARVLAVSVT